MYDLEGELNAKNDIDSEIIFPKKGVVKSKNDRVNFQFITSDDSIKQNFYVVKVLIILITERHILNNVLF